MLTVVFDYKYETILCDCQTGQMSKHAGQRHSWEEIVPRVEHTEENLEALVLTGLRLLKEIIFVSSH